MTDWKAYEDGSMPQAERDRLHEALQSDEALRRNYEGYRSFVSTLRDQVLREPIPHGSLRLSRPPAVRRSFLIAGGLTAVVASVMLVAPVFSRSPEVTRNVAFATSPEIARLETQRPEEASRWLIDRVGLNAPVIDVPDKLKIVHAAFGKDWGGYTYTCQEGSLTLRFAKSDPFESCSTVTIAGQVFYEANGIGWRQEGLSFMLTGSPDVPLQTYAEIMHRGATFTQRMSISPMIGTK